MINNIINHKTQGENALMPQNGVVPFQNETLNCTVRAVVKDGEPWFVAKDVCDALEIGNSRQAVSYLDDDEKGVTTNDTLGGTQQVSIINESGLYSLILRSRKPEAKKFKKWVTAEVLPSIRKHGAYATKAKLEEMLSDPDAMILTLQALKAEREKRKALEAKAAEDAPYAHFGRCVEVSEGCILIGEFAKILAQNGMETGQNRLFEYLRNEGIMGRHGNRHNVPAQEYIEAGYFRLTYRVIQRSDGSQQSKPTPYLTPRGQIWLMKRLGLTLENIPAA
ncbi:phage antirepressor [Akkermansia muciniphila]|uniref:phage antirepressor n=1 Tax=Akkermansia muciniphila TaxID=239935 RepID=UPI001C63C593|nr:phage antirepressor [Akkermansia muciniphila]